VLVSVRLAGRPAALHRPLWSPAPATLAVRLHRARKALKQRLVEMCLTCPEHGFMDCGCDTARWAELLRATAAAKG
ncbi:MAG: hypothetical protein U1D06_10545, partial [Paracoccaceae bacterium]|nr:hypothetical protein [Paracoccaceae bacterium]